MTTFTFSTLVDGQDIAFDPAVDLLKFDLSSVSAADLRIAWDAGRVSLTVGDKTVWLDDTALGQLSGSGSELNVVFSDGSSSTRSVLAIGDNTTDALADWYGRAYKLGSSSADNQVWGLGGADSVACGSGDDHLVGNLAINPLNHVSRAGSTGAPTGTSAATVSADGNLVSFSGGWTAFGSVNDNATDVLVKNLATGAISDEHTSASGQLGGSGSGRPVISADGQWLAFDSASSGLVDGPASGSLYDIYVAEVGGPGIERVNTGSSGALAADGRSTDADLSGDGRYVVFQSSTTGWVASNANSTTDIFMKDRVEGALTRISTSTGGNDGNGESTAAKVSADGRYVVFQSDARNLTAGDSNGYSDVFVWDRADGSLRNLTEALPGKNLNNGSYLPDVAFDEGVGGVVVFQTAKRLVAADLSNNTDIYAYNLKDGTLSLVSSQADGDGVQLSSEDASVSGDGRFVTFSSYSDDLVPGDGGARDIFVKDLRTGAIALVSQAEGGPSNGASSRAQISLGGEWIVFQSTATNLAGSDGNGGFDDVFRVSNPLLFDTLEGGAGNDTYVLNRADLIIEAVDGGTDTVQSSISTTLGANLENLTLSGTANRAGTGNALDNLITGNAGNNVLKGGDGVDTASYEPASAAVVVSLAITGAQTTGFGSDTLTSIEALRGSAFNDRLTGNGGANRLDGRAGSDTLTGGAGDDTYVVGAASDVVVESSGAGLDTVVSSVHWTLQSALENLTLTGSGDINGGGNSAANLIKGNGGANGLKGGSEADTLSGADGNDTLAGESGSDRLTGGGGADTFALNSSAGSDTLTDFGNGADVLRIGQSALRIGDGDLLVEGAIKLAGPGGFSHSAELVIVSSNLGGLGISAAAAAIGAANSAYAVGRSVLFVVDDGSSSAVYRFTAANADALVSSGELDLLATLDGTASTVLADFVFGN